eukprot:341210_1
MATIQHRKEFDQLSERLSSLECELPIEQHKILQNAKTIAVEFNHISLKKKLREESEKRDRLADIKQQYDREAELNAQNEHVEQMKLLNEQAELQKIAVRDGPHFDQRVHAPFGNVLCLENFAEYKIAFCSSGFLVVWRRDSPSEPADLLDCEPA